MSVPLGASLPASERTENPDFTSPMVLSFQYEAIVLHCFFLLQKDTGGDLVELVESFSKRTPRTKLQLTSCCKLLFAYRYLRPKFKLYRKHWPGRKTTVL